MRYEYFVRDDGNMLISGLRRGRATGSRYVPDVRQRAHGWLEQVAPRGTLAGKGTWLRCNAFRTGTHGLVELARKRVHLHFGADADAVPTCLIDGPPRPRPPNSLLSPIKPSRPLSLPISSPLPHRPGRPGVLCCMHLACGNATPPPLPTISLLPRPRASLNRHKPSRRA